MDVFMPIRPFYRYDWYCLSTNTVVLIELSWYWLSYRQMLLWCIEKMDVLMPITEAAHVDAMKKRLLLRKRPQGNYVPVFWTCAWTVLRLSTDICTAFSKFGQCQRGGGAQQVRGAPRSPGQIGRIWAAMAITVGKFGTPVLARSTVRPDRAERVKGNFKK